ncbi:MAG: Uma2 family endonuclease [Gemmataceae bacterium]|nr:Uma2 family endonuclease [Gemmataceae bacterium]
MADNTVQFDWIAILKWGLDIQYRADPDVFVAGDHLIYPVEGNNKLRQAPDVYVAFGRPKGQRGSYKVWEEGGVFPQVVFEVWSPHNRLQQMNRRFRFYQKYGAEEYYVVYPEFPAHVEAWRRDGGKLVPAARPGGWTSPRTGLRFEVVKGELAAYGRDGRPLVRPTEYADAERERAEAERVRADKLAARLRELGVDPDAV